MYDQPMRHHQRVRKQKLHITSWVLFLALLLNLLPYSLPPTQVYAAPTQQTTPTGLGGNNLSVSTGVRVTSNVVNSRPERAADGSTATSWKITRDTRNAYIDIELYDPAIVNRVRIFWGGTRKPAYTLAMDTVSFGGLLPAPLYSTVSSAAISGTNTADVIDLQANTFARGIRVIISDGADNQSDQTWEITELEIANVAGGVIATPGVAATSYYTFTSSSGILPDLARLQVVSGGSKVSGVANAFDGFANTNATLLNYFPTSTNLLAAGTTILIDLGKPTTYNLIRLATDGLPHRIRAFAVNEDGDQEFALYDNSFHSGTTLEINLVRPVRSRYLLLDFPSYYGSIPIASINVGNSNTNGGGSGVFNPDTGLFDSPSRTRPANCPSDSFCYSGVPFFSSSIGIVTPSPTTLQSTTILPSPMNIESACTPVNRTAVIRGEFRLVNLIELGCYLYLDPSIVSASIVTLTTVTVPTPPTSTPRQPSARDDYYSTAQNTSLNVAVTGVLANDGAYNNGNTTAYAISLDNLPRNGQVKLKIDGSFIYTPTTGFRGVDSFTYRASNGAARSEPALVTISVGQTIEGEWRLDEANWNGTTGEVKDSSGNQFNGTAQNSATTANSSPAKSGDPGTCNYGVFGGNDKAVSIPYTQDLNPAGDFTAAFWAYSTGGTGNRAALTSRDTISVSPTITQARVGFNVLIGSSGNWEFWTGGGQSSDWQKTVGTTVVPTNQWQHVVVRFDANSSASGVYTGTKTLFVDGVKQAETTNATYRPQTINPFYIGIANNNELDFIGNLDEVRLYRGLLSDTMIADLKNNTHTCAPGLRGNWSFSENSGSTTVNSVTNVNATISNATWTTGVKGSALQFNSTSAVVDSGANAVNTANDFAVAAWVKLDNLNNWQTAVSQDGNANTGFFLQYSQLLGNKFAFAFLSGDVNGATATRALSTFSPQTGVWYHLVGVHDAANNQIKLYVNGLLQQSVTFSNHWNATGNLIIGRAKVNGGSVDYWSGAIDEVQVYNKVLNTSEVLALAQPTLIGYWPLSVDGLNLVTGADGSLSNVSFVSGRSGFAAQFNGSTAVVDAGSNVVNTQGSFSVGAWVKLDNLNGWQSAVSQDGANISGFFLQYSQALGNKFAFTMVGNDDTSAPSTRALSTFSPQIGVWYHLLGVHDTTGVERFYVNGVRQGEFTFGTPWNASGNLVIGRAKWAGHAVDYWNGAIDEVTVYNKALSDSEARQVAAPNLIGYWALDGNSSNSVTGAAGTASNTTTTTGKVGNALQFNGTSAVADSGANSVNTAGDFSVAAWVKLNTLNGWQTAVSQDGLYNSSFFLQYSQSLGNKFAFAFLSGDAGPTSTRALATSSPVVGTWYHLVGVHDATNNQIKLYVNGVLQQSVAFSTHWNVVGNLVIGRAKAGGGGLLDYWNGAIDEVQVYNKVLSDADISNLYSGTNNGVVGAANVEEVASPELAPAPKVTEPLVIDEASLTQKVYLPTISNNPANQ